MKILYMSAICPESQYQHLMQNGAVGFSVAAHKFNKLLADGLAAKDGVSLSRIVSNAIHQRLEPVLTAEDYQSDKYVYLKLCRGRLRHVKFLVECLKYIRKIKNTDRDTVLVCDALGRTFSLACILAKWFYKLKAVAVITDLPQYFGSPYGELKKKLMDKADLWYMNRFSAYVLLTEPMGFHVNKKQRPYCIIEGLCDARIKDVSEEQIKKYAKKTCVYIGTMSRRADGILELIQAFDAEAMQNYELHLYGSCSFINNLSEICEKTSNIQYRGFASDSDIGDAERRACLLVHPALPDSEWTKHFFPSKIMGYLASGTPVVTTKLPCIPDEYYDYVYLFEDETAEGMRGVLCNLLNRPEEELREKGAAAREFVLREKNNILQAKKIYNILSHL